MTDQQVTGVLVLAAMSVLFLGVWFFGHPDDRRKNLRRMKVVLRFVLRFCLYMGFYGAIALYIGTRIGGDAGALLALLIMMGGAYLWGKAEEFEE